MRITSHYVHRFPTPPAYVIPAEIRIEKAKANL